MADEAAETDKTTSAAAKKATAKTAVKKSASKPRATSSAKSETPAEKKATTPKKTRASSKPKASQPSSTASKKPADIAADDIRVETQKNGSADAPESDGNHSTSGDGSNDNEARMSSGSHKHSFDSGKVIEDLKGRDWGQIISRALLMFFFGVLGTFALYLAFFLAVTQVFFSIFSGAPNGKLTGIMLQLSGYVKDVIAYLSFSSDDLPFPFGKDIPPSD